MVQARELVCGQVCLGIRQKTSQFRDGIVSGRLARWMALSIPL